MGYNYYQRQRRTTNTDVGQDARFDELGMYGLYQSPHHESSFLANQLDNAGQVMLAARREPEFDENGLEISGTGDTELDAYWINASLRTTQARDIDPIDLAKEDLSGLSLEAQEEIKGLQTERRRHREKALAADLVGTERASRRRDELEAEYAQRRVTHENNWVIDHEPGRTQFDAVGELDDDTVGVIEDAVERLCEQFVTPLQTAAVKHRLALKTLAGQDIITATSNLQEELHQEAGVVQPIATVPAVPSKYDVEADIQGEVVTLWEPKATNQQQVGLIEDETGTIKFTIWRRSNQNVILHEGDHVRILAGKAGKYQGDATLAADSETIITVLKRGDGPAPRQPAFEISQGTSGQNPRPCTIPSLTDPGVTQVSMPTHRPPDRRDADDGRYAGTHWLQSAEIYEDEGDIPIPEWWANQPNVLEVEVPADANSQVRNQYIEAAIAKSEGDAESESDDGSGNSDDDDDLRPSSQSIATDAHVRSALTADGGETRTLWVSLPELPKSPSVTDEVITEAESVDTIEMPSTIAQCPAPACDSERAYYRLQQLRAADEAPTRLYTCTCCGKTWREND
ncbi:hypothetical protein ACOZ4N_01330 (plasmid) [Halorientalis pallida]|uniref:hypothetical protein n=1 Tax=Halorientalis pallida TaxID=2479928 RepID=UPI003C7056C8